jgi:hypothetical protein
VEGGFEPGDVAESALDGFVLGGDGCWSRTRAVHRQHHHPLPRLSPALEEAGLVPLGAYGVDDDCHVEQPVDEDRHGKAVIVARRAER